MLSRAALLGIFAVGGVCLAIAVAGPAHAACTCLCVNGKPKAQCPSVLEKPPVCPADICAGARVATPPMSKREDCQIVQVVNPDTQRVERRMMCK